MGTPFRNCEVWVNPARNSVVAASAAQAGAKAANPSISRGNTWFSLRRAAHFSGRSDEATDSLRFRQTFSATSSALQSRRLLSPRSQRTSAPRQPPQAIQHLTDSNEKKTTSARSRFRSTSLMGPGRSTRGPLEWRCHKLRTTDAQSLESSSQKCETRREVCCG